MHTPTHRHSEAAAHALALMVAANGHIDDRELRVLDGLDAYRRLGASRKRFVALAQACVSEVGTDLCRRAWLQPDQRCYVDKLLDAVPEPDQRLLVCRLAAAVITADGCITDNERLVYEHTLGRWGISRERVSQAILRDSRH